MLARRNACLEPCRSSTTVMARHFAMVVVAAAAISIEHHA